MSGPSADDVILQVALNGTFELVEAITGKLLVKGESDSLIAAVQSARRNGAKHLWRQLIDSHGRPLGKPFRLSRSFDK